MVDRDDLAEQESRELGIISVYLPRQLSDEALKEKIAAVIESTGAAGAADMGRVMGTLMPQIADSAKAAVADAKLRGGSYGRAF